MAANAMNYLVVERDTDVSGKLLVSKECAPATGIRHQTGCGQIDFFGSHARREHGRNFIENLAGEPTGRSHVLNFLPRLNGNHPESVPQYRRKQPRRHVRPPPRPAAFHKPYRPEPFYPSMPPPSAPKLHGCRPISSLTVRRNLGKDHGKI